MSGDETSGPDWIVEFTEDIEVPEEILRDLALAEQTHLRKLFETPEKMKIVRRAVERTFGIPAQFLASLGDSPFLNVDTYRTVFYHLTDLRPLEDGGFHYPVIVAVDFDDDLNFTSLPEALVLPREQREADAAHAEKCGWNPDASVVLEKE